jgi:Leucine-rich repeat (LRR) protein
MYYSQCTDVSGFTFNEFNFESIYLIIITTDFIRLPEYDSVYLKQSNEVLFKRIVMIKHSSLLLLLFAFITQQSIAQVEADSSLFQREFVSLDEAFKNPQQVYRLNLSEQAFQIPDSAWAKFTNLRYLSLKNDHLEEIPEGIGYVQSLQVLDLSGNDFEFLPSSFTNLANLQELYINDDEFFNLEENIDLLSSMPSLNSLHIENDGLTSLPENISKLDHIEYLYINNNNFEQVPSELSTIPSLQYVEMQGNKFLLPEQSRSGQGFGFKIRF